MLALSLLCRFGGIGSKSRKGFGSLHWNEAWSFDECNKMAKQLAGEFERQSSVNNNEYSFSKALIPKPIDIPTKNEWLAIDKLGLVLKQFASSLKHDPGKAVLGLPRKIRGRTPQFKRFAAPIWYHFEPSGNGLKLSILAFYSGKAVNKVVNEDVSKATLQKLLKHLKENLTSSIFPAKSTGFARNTPRTPLKSQPTTTKASGIKVGDKITGILLEEKTKKGGWKVETKELAIGSIQNSGDVPPDKKIGDTVNLEVRIAQTGGGGAQFKWIP